MSSRSEEPQWLKVPPLATLDPVHARCRDVGMSAILGRPLGERFQIF
jgi:hypothetical protein